MVDVVSEASDEFDTLPAVLPLLRAHPITETAPLFPPYFDDDFARWQLDRFNRSGFISICSILSSSINSVAPHCKFLILAYLLYFVCLIGAFFSNHVFLFVILQSLSHLLATAMTFSLIAGSPFYDRFALIFSMPGLTAFGIQTVKSLILYHTLRSIYVRSSAITVNFIVLIIAHALTLFHSCFVFEGLSLSFGATCSFSLQLSFFAIPLLQLLGLFLSGMAMSALAPVTLGLAEWTSYFMRAFVFLAVCGSGTNIQNIPGI
jgi:hypothetical protein